MRGCAQGAKVGVEVESQDDFMTVLLEVCIVLLLTLFSGCVLV